MFYHFFLLNFCTFFDIKVFVEDMSVLPANFFKKSNTLFVVLLTPSALQVIRKKRCFYNTAIQ